MSLIRHKCKPGVPCNSCAWNANQGGEVNHPGVAVRRSTRRPPIKIKPCRFRGSPTGDSVDCDSCDGKVSLKLFACDVHGRCTLGKKVSGVHCCNGCTDNPDEQIGALIPVAADRFEMPPPRRPNVVATLAVGRRGGEMLSIAGPLMRRYADRIGADFVPITGDPVNAEYPLADKFRLGQLVERWERCLFLDVDTIVGNDCENLFDLVPAGSVGYHDDRPNLTSTAFIYGEIRRADSTVEPRQVVNSGVVVWDRDTPDVWKSPGGLPKKPNSSVPHHIAEQCAVQVNIERAGYKAVRLPERYNYQWWADRKFERLERVNPAIVHLAGVSQVNLVDEWRMQPNEWRIALMRLFAWVNKVAP